LQYIVNMYGSTRAILWVIMYIIYISLKPICKYCNVMLHVMIYVMQLWMKLYDASDEYKNIDEDKGNRAVD